MNRKDFLKKLGFVSVAAVVAPNALAHNPEKKFIAGCDPAMPGGDITVINTALIPDSMTPEEWLKTYKETGMLIYQYSGPGCYHNPK